MLSVLVLDIHPDVTLPIGSGLFRFTTKINRASDGTIVGVDHRRVRSCVAENPDPLIEGVKHDSVGPSLNINRFDGCQCFGIEHHNGAAADEAVMGLGVDGCAARIRVGNFSH
jgi:hypothetical protein